MDSVEVSLPTTLLQHEFERLSNNPLKPPAGYVFVPKGDVYITRNCRNLTGVSGRNLWIVYDRETNERLGIHCFQQIVEAVKEDAALTEEKRQRAVAAKDSRDHERAHQLLLEFFPNIPKEACTEILEHGFQKGSGRVGRSQTLEDKMKVQLAVNAHIRHRLTRYDSILAAGKGQGAKLEAREIVYGQIQAIADSWRGATSQTSTSESRTSIPASSAATLKANRQRRSQQREAQIIHADEDKILEEALGGLRLNEKQREAGEQAEAAQRLGKKMARKVARKSDFSEKTRNLLRQYELDSSIEMSKRQRKKIHRLRKEENEKARDSKHSRKVHGRQDPNPTKPIKRGRNRKLRVTAHGVELEPRESDRYVPDHGPSDDEPRNLRLPSPSDEEPRKQRLLRSNYRKAANTPTNSGDLADKHGRGGQLEAGKHDRYVPNYGPDPSADPPRKSRYPLRSSHRRTGDFHGNNGEGLRLALEPTYDDRAQVEDSEWMDIDDISFRTAGVYLA